MASCQARVETRTVDLIRQGCDIQYWRSALASSALPPPAVSAEIGDRLARRQTVEQQTLLRVPQCPPVLFLRIGLEAF